MKAVKVTVSTELIARSLHMPDTAYIIGARWEDKYNQSVVFTIWDDSFPDVEEPPEVNPTVTERRSEWNWHYPS